METALSSDAVWDDLTFSEQFLLWAIRMWAQLSDDPMRAHEFISPAFDRVGAEGAGALFHSFMCGVTACARRRIEVRCPRSAEICRDERGLLHVFHDCQAGASDAAYVRLASYVHGDAVPHIMLHARLLMRACAADGITLRMIEESGPVTPGDRSGDGLAISPGITVH
jgi:hypothetical protein